jgi:hypothetical protein
MTRHAINALTAVERNKCNNIFTLAVIVLEHTHHPATMHFKHFTFPMVHPVTGKILSYKKVMNETAIE